MESIQKNVPKEYPNILFNDIQRTDEYLSHKKGKPKFKRYIRVILWLKTPVRNDVSKYYQTVKANLDAHGWKDTSVNEALEEIKKTCVEEAQRVYKSELKKGYTLSPVFIYGAHI